MSPVPKVVYVVIPFFQHQRGILIRALNSIAHQSGSQVSRVLIVDDGSPVSPEMDIKSSVIDPTCVTVIRQFNAGPAAARNRGLDEVPTDIDYVAFLDSDDEWTASHLENAILTMGDTGDFYFSNYREPEAAVDQFSILDRIRIQEHEIVPGSRSGYRYCGDMEAQIVFANIIQLSTVVFRWKPLQSLRFRTDYLNACEDHLYFLAMVRCTSAFSFSMEVDVQYGRGINIWRSARMGSNRALPRLVDERRYCGELLASGRFSESQLARIQQKISAIRESVVVEVLHNLSRLQLRKLAGLKSYASVDPEMLARAPRILARIILRKLGRQLANDAGQQK